MYLHSQRKSDSLDSTFIFLDKICKVIEIQLFPCKKMLPLGDVLEWKKRLPRRHQEVTFFAMLTFNKSVIYQFRVKLEEQTIRNTIRHLLRLENEIYAAQGQHHI